MKPTTLAAERIHLQLDEPIDELRHSYPELDFVFDKLDELKATVDQLIDENTDLIGRMADLEDDGT